MDFAPPYTPEVPDIYKANSPELQVARLAGTCSQKNECGICNCAFRAKIACTLLRIDPGDIITKKEVPPEALRIIESIPRGEFTYEYPPDNSEHADRITILRPSAVRLSNVQIEEK